MFALLLKYLQLFVNKGADFFELFLTYDSNPSYSLLFNRFFHKERNISNFWWITNYLLLYFPFSILSLFVLRGRERRKDKKDVAQKMTFCAWSNFYLKVSRIMVKRTNLPRRGTTREVGGIISANSKKNTVRDSKIEIDRDT